MQSKRITNIIIIKYSQIRFNTMKQSKMQSKRITKLKVMRGDLNPPVDLTQWRWAMSCGRNGWLTREKALTVDRGVITGTQVSLITLIRGLLLSCGGARLIGWASGGTTRTRCIRGEGFRSYEQRLCLSPLWKGLVGDWRHSCLSPPGVRETVTAVTHITLTGEREKVTCVTHITLTGVRETVTCVTHITLTGVRDSHLRHSHHSYRCERDSHLHHSHHSYRCERDSEWT